MTAPNLIAPSNIVGNNATFSTISTSSTHGSQTTIVQNAASSNKSYRIHTIYACNLSSAYTGRISLFLNSDLANVSTGAYTAYQIEIPPYSTVILANKEAPLWLLENQKLTVYKSGSPPTTINVTCSWEEIS